MYPFGGLPENLTTFCGLLRQDFGFRIGAGEVLDAARALEVVDLSNSRAVRHALRAVLASSRDDVVVFDRAFDQFFFPVPGETPRGRPPTSRRVPGDGPGGDPLKGRRRAVDTSAEVDELTGGGTGPMSPLASGEGDEASRVVRAAYSPLGSESTEGPVLEDVDEPWVHAARLLVRRVQLGLSRRWRPVVRGRRFDFRRTLRASLQTGGEALAPRWLGRPRRTPRFVMLVDGSRSMSAFAGTALKMATALAHATSRLEVFTFSTDLRRVTAEVRRAAQGRRGRLPGLAYAWGGGTRIGACFAEFLRRGERVWGRQTVVIVVSDGLDVGDPATLVVAMRALSRGSSAIVWLNPLAESRGYEPTALGMRIAWPYITTFASANDAAGLLRLSRSVRIKG
jgi:uncharacterized protein with von Willebrand factor type A (vWA) domain